MLASIAVGLLTAWLTTYIYTIFSNVFHHPLASFPGPKAVATGWFKAYQELYLGRSWLDVLRELHVTYGDVVRVGPNELHFSSPAAYHEIYNSSNRWDKEASLYHSFGEDRSSFGFLTYRDAKQRRDVLAPMFSRRAIAELQGLVKAKIWRLCDALAREHGQSGDDGKRQSSDMLFALRCFTLDTIMGFCFAKDVESTEAEGFQAPIVVAMDASLPGFVVFRHFEWVRKIVFSMPGWLTKLTNPALAGLVDLQELLGAQVDEVVQNPASLQQTSHPTVYHRLMDPEINKAAGGVPSPGSLYEEAQALFFGGADTAANTAMVGLFYILKNPVIHARLLAELAPAWRNKPDLVCPAPTCNSSFTELEAMDTINLQTGAFHCKTCHTPLLSSADFDPIPSIDQLERLPYLTAIIKESLRLSPSVPAPLPRIVPATGATPTIINGRTIPPGTIVAMSHLFVHSSPLCFPSPETFDPDRWLQPDGRSAALEKWLVAFSRGPRSCLGQNLGLCELYFAFAVLVWKFDMELDGTTAQDLTYRECFLPAFQRRHMRAFCRLVVRE